MKQNLQAGRGRFLRLIFLSWLLVAAQAACVKLPRRAASLSGHKATPAALASAQGQPLININTATPAELEKLPGIGQALAARIVEHRQKYGRFRRVEHLLAVRGISERRFRALSALLAAE
ncbi:MAG: competence protein ComEA [Blastocatellia bacterium]|jgi:competence ComEA-like helix-hairpin-helix protein|nr:competence protein ComEA [Blastocatellia bacterium]